MFPRKVTPMLLVSALQKCERTRRYRPTKGLLAWDADTLRHHKVNAV